MPLGIDHSEYEMLNAISKILGGSRALPDKVEIPARIIVETVCAEDCAGRMPSKCAAAPPPPPRLPRAKDFLDSFSAVDWQGGLEVFMEGTGKRNVMPWLVYL